MSNGRLSSKLHNNNQVFNDFKKKTENVQVIDVKFQVNIFFKSKRVSNNQQKNITKQQWFFI